jgi:hypothetical protein
MADDRTGRSPNDSVAKAHGIVTVVTVLYASRTPKTPLLPRPLAPTSILSIARQTERFTLKKET